MKHVFLASILAVTSAFGAQAAPAGFTDFVGFGDSFSDKGRLPLLFSTIPPRDGSRFSDGPTWMERVGAAFEAMGGGNVNMAIGGATAGPNTPDRLLQYAGAEPFNGPRNPNDPDDIPFVELNNFAAQINAFLTGPTTSAVGGLASTVGSNPLVTVLLGGNDFLGLPDAPTPTQFNTVANTVISSLSLGIQTLAAADAKFDDFMISNMPSFSRAPNLFSPPGADPLLDAQKAAFDIAIQQFNAALALNMDSLGTSLGVTIEIFDLYSTFDARYAEGIAAGLIADDSCLPGGGVNNCDAPGESSHYLFLDNVHPNSFIHEGIADGALATVQNFAAPVPLPAGGALLLFGLGTLVVARRRAA